MKKGSAQRPAIRELQAKLVPGINFAAVDELVDSMVLAAKLVNGSA